jgi:diaminohydroxyphosphoribosylaminopyrimidine deaminase / 5-amino-6-(5-phosphoribosylamino)uracil reductase
VNEAFGETDRRFMQQALRLAERGRGQTRPNPVVGAIVVKEGAVIARGFHHRAGGPHAEIEALAALGRRASQATLYVTLEPCCHRGRTGPCTEAILASGISRVVVGCRDENPLVSGRGMAILRKAGIRVDAGCLEEACRLANRTFFCWVKNKRPWVTLKAAATLDGFIGDRQEKSRRGQQRWITGEAARSCAHELRAQHDAILVGVGTVLADDPRLTVRLPKAKAYHPLPLPLRIVLDSQLRTPADAAIFGEGSQPPLLVAAKTARLDRRLLARQRALEAAGAEIWFAPATPDGRVSLPALMRRLASREIQSLLLEGGSRIHGAFIAAGLVDSVALFLAPRLVGAGVSIVEGAGLDWRRPATLGPLAVRVLGDDVLLTADVVNRGRRRHP